MNGSWLKDILLVAGLAGLLVGTAAVGAPIGLGTGAAASTEFAGGDCHHGTCHDDKVKGGGCHHGGCHDGNSSSSRN